MFPSNSDLAKESGTGFAEISRTRDDKALTELVLAINSIICQQTRKNKSAIGSKAVMRSSIKLVTKSAFGKKTISNITKAVLGRGLGGAAGAGNLSRLMRSNLAVAFISTAVACLPDLYLAAIAKKISWQQFGKNVTVNAAGLGGGTGGWFAGLEAGSLTGAAIPGVGAELGAIWGGFICAMAGGLIVGKIVKVCADSLVDDDALKMIRLLQGEAEKTVCQCNLTNAQIQQLAALVQEHIDHRWLRKMYASGGDDAMRRQFAKGWLKQCCQNLQK